MKLIYLFTVLFFAANILFAATNFNDINVVLPLGSNPETAWCDYDNDNDQDFIYSTYIYSTSTRYTDIYRNDSGEFTPINSGITGCNGGNLKWGDYDNDGDQDLLITGYSDAGYTSKIYRNDGGGIFTDLNAGLTGVYDGSADWGDYDNDGDLDIFLAGDTGSGRVVKIYNNDSGIFSEIVTGFPAMDNSIGIAWADYDNDYDLDVMLTGYAVSIGAFTEIYRNDGTDVFTDIDAGLPGLIMAVIDWGDYDNDGDPDILVSGYLNPGYFTTIYRNDGGGVFTDIDPPLTDCYQGSVEWGDLDNDGYLDILLTGYYWGGTNYNVSKIYHNDQNGVFTDINAGITGVAYGSSTWGDYDNDLDLDLIITGEDINYNQVAKIYRTDMDFINIITNITGVSGSEADWGDYDNDGDLDIVISGNTGTALISKIYRNDSGVFTDINAGLAGANCGDVEWCDFDNDGDLDILLSGDNWISSISKIYRNDSGVFTDINAGLPGTYYSVSKWGDYDNDGDADVLLSGSTGSGFISKIFRNDNNVIFTDINAGLTNLVQGSAAWGDYNNDGDLDILLTGSTDSGVKYSRIYRNDSGVFIVVNPGLTDVSSSSCEWGDYDNDGDLDILLSGMSGTENITKIYRNDKNDVFTDINAGLTGVSYSSSEWGDYDNDGDLDILITGYTSSGRISKIYRNDWYYTFTDISSEMTGLNFGDASWGDYDNDGDLDVFLSGSDDNGTSISKLYRNNSAVHNTSPAKPSRLITALEADSLNLSFNPSTDIQTPQNGLSYNIDVMINGETVLSGMSRTSDGKRKIVGTGNASLNKFFRLTNFKTDLPQTEKRLVWKVQAIDQCFAGSEFASSLEFVFESSTDLLLSSKTEMAETDMLKWEYVYPEYLDYYVIQIDDNQYFTSPMEQTINIDKTSKTLWTGIALTSLTQFSELQNNVTYFWRMKPVYLGVNRFTKFTETPLSFVYLATALSAPNPPVSGFNPANDDIESSLPKLSWNVATDPDGHAEDLYYICQLDTISTFTTIQYADTTAAGISSVQVGSTLPEGYRYYYRVKTIDADALQSVWSAYQTFLVVMPPQDVKIMDDGTNVNLTWDAVPVNSKGVVYTVYSSINPYAAFPSGWTVAATQLTSPAWSEPHSATKKFYRITVGSSSK